MNDFDKERFPEIFALAVRVEDGDEEKARMLLQQEWEAIDPVAVRMLGKVNGGPVSITELLEQGEADKVKEYLQWCIDRKTGAECSIHMI